MNLRIYLTINLLSVGRGIDQIFVNFMAYQRDWLGWFNIHSRAKNNSTVYFTEWKIQIYPCIHIYKDTVFEHLKIVTISR